MRERERERERERDREREGERERVREREGERGRGEKAETYACNVILAVLFLRGFAESVTFTENSYCFDTSMFEAAGI